MPGLLLKDFPDELHRRLNERAARNHRSMAKEALAILQSVLRAPAGPPPLDEVDAWRIDGAKALTDELLEEARSVGRP
jgi:plasmid stability protein